MSAHPKEPRRNNRYFLTRLMFTVVLSATALPVCPSEAAIRTAFVYNFIKFIDWPQTETDSIFHLCVLHPSGEYADATAKLNGMQAKQKTIDIHYLHDKKNVASEITHCQLIYRTLASKSLELPQPLPEGVVLVADEPSATDNNVGIALLQGNDGRLTFKINQTAIGRSGVTVSSQLLKLSTQHRGSE